MNQSIVNIVIIIVAAVVLFLVIKFLNSHNQKWVPNVPLKENFEPNSNPMNDLNNNYESVNENQQVQNTQQLSGGNPPQLVAKDLLPTNASTDWAKVNPVGQGSLKDKNLLQAGYLNGINTVGQTLRNANLQLRSDPPNPQVKVSPWLQSTIDPDTNRQPLEIGCGY